MKQAKGAIVEGSKGGAVQQMISGRARKGRRGYRRGGMRWRDRNLLFWNKQDRAGQSIGRPLSNRALPKGGAAHLPVLRWFRMMNRKRGWVRLRARAGGGGGRVRDWGGEDDVGRE